MGRSERRSTVVFTTLTLHDRHSTPFCRREEFEKPRHQRTQVVEAVAACGEHNYRDVERGNILLVRKVAISGEKSVELACRQGKQFAIALAGPTHLRRGLHVVADELALQ